MSFVCSVKRVFRLSCSVLISASLVLPSIALAQSQPASWFQPLVPSARKNIIVDVRTLKASDMVVDDEQLGRSSLTPQELRLDKRLEDLRPKLQRLNFRTFRLISSAHTSLPMTRRETIGLSNGHTLIVRPIGADIETICLWLKWLDQKGHPILDTRLHVPRNESILAGTDHSADSGMILAISVGED